MSGESSADPTRDLLRSVLEDIPDAVAISDTEARFTVFNRAAEKLLNIRAIANPSNDCATRYGIFLSDGITPYPEHELPLLRALRGESITGILLTIRNELHPDGVQVSSSARPLRDADGRITGAILVCHDVSPMHKAKMERIRTLNWLTFLSEASALMGASLNYKDALNHLATRAVEDFADLCTCGLLDDGWMEIVARGIKGQGLVGEPVVRYRISTLAEDHPVIESLRSGKPVAISETAGHATWAQTVAATDDQRDLLRSLDLDLYILAPITAHAKTFGVLAFGFRHPESGADASQILAFAAEIGRRVGVAIDNALLHQTVAISEERYRALSESVPQLVWSCRPDGFCVYLSPQWAEFTGVPVGQHLGWNWYQALHPDDGERALAQWQSAVRRAGNYDIEYRMRRFDGTYRWFKARGLPLHDESGAITHWFGTSTDIDDLKKVQQAEKESRERLSAALEASGTGTFRWNIGTNQLDFDENLDRLFGLPPGRTVWTLDQFVALVHPEDAPSVREALTRCAAEAADFNLEYRVVWPDGSIHWLYDRGRTIVENGKPAYMAGACVDITARVEVRKASLNI
jgi:PAS domain S-box-containing protein